MGLMTRRECLVTFHRFNAPLTVHFVVFEVLSNLALLSSMQVQRLLPHWTRALLG